MSLSVTISGWYLNCQYMYNMNKLTKVLQYISLIGVDQEYYQKRIFGTLTPCSGALMQVVLLLPLEAPVFSGCKNATMPNRWYPEAYILSISDSFCVFSDKPLAPDITLIPGIGKEGVLALTIVRTVFLIVTLLLRAPVAPEVLLASYLPYQLQFAKLHIIVYVREYWLSVS